MKKAPKNKPAKKSTEKTATGTRKLKKLSIEDMKDVAGGDCCISVRHAAF